MPFIRSLCTRKLAWWGATITLALGCLYIERTPGAASLGAARRGVAQAPSPARTRIRLAENYARLPLSFEANRGQVESQVRFLARGRGYSLFLTGTSAVLEGQESAAAGHASPAPATFTMQLVGANPGATARGADELPGKANYFIGNNRSLWRTNVPTYARVVYKNVYPGVDLAYYGNQGRLEYDFVVEPGADPGLIRLALDGNLRVASNGDLVVKAGGSDVRFEKPVVYQPEGSEAGPLSRRSRVEGHYVLRGQQAGFQVASYDRSRPLVIDPVLSFSTFLGGGGGSAPTNSANGIALDTAGNVYVTGATSSTTFPTTTGVKQTTLGGLQNAFVSELNASGTTLIYSTYLGGGGTDTGFGIAVDSGGNAYVTGATNSTNFPVTSGVKQTTLKGGDDAFVTKVGPGGASLLYSTYLGGSLDDQGNAIAVDSTGNAYITGVTASSDFPTTQFPFQIATGGGFDAFFVKLNSGGGAPLLYGTYLGGSGNDIGHDIAIDSSGNAYIAGETASGNFPVTVGVAQGLNGGGSDAFVAKFNPAVQSAASLVYSTFVGGASDDFGFGIALDSSNNAYVTGQTASTNFPTTTGVVQPVLGGGTDDAFVTKVNSTGAAFVYSTYLGGNGFDRGNSIAVDAAGNTYVTGNTQSTDFTGLPAAAAKLSPVQASCTGVPCDDAFVTSLNSGGTAFVYSTYLGGSAHAEGDKIALDSAANAYVAGSTLSADFPATAGVVQAGCALSSTNACNSAVLFKLTASPAVAAVPGVLSFGEQLLNTTSASQTTTLTNNSGTTLSNIVFSASGDFAVAAAGTTCSTSLAAAATCNIAITFAPKVAGARTGALTITDSAGTQSALLAGTGTSSLVSLSPTSLTFNQSVGATSKPQTVTLTNTGAAALSMISISVPQPYAQTNTCGSSVAAGGNCTISVTFSPTKSGSANGSLTITDNATNSPQTVTLTGTGEAAAVTLAPGSLNFNSVNVGVTSSAQSVTLMNSGNQTLSSINFSVTGTNAGDFKISSNNCGSTLPQSQSCTFMVTFTPATGNASASRSAAVSIADNAPGSPQSLALSGMGADFSTAANPGSATVSAGNAATFTLTETSVGGFNSAVALTCTAPTGFLGSCVISPTSVTPTASAAGSATVTVSTLAPAGTAPGPGSRWLPPGPVRLLPWLALLLGMAGLALASRRRRFVGLAFAGVLLMAMLAVACGSASNPATSAGTTPGSYTFTLTGTANSLAHTTTVTVTVTGG